MLYPQRPSAPFPSNARYIAAGFKLPALGIVTLSTLVLAALGVVYWFFSKPPSNAVSIDSIAVMPFVNESGNSDVEYLSDGITESLINSLSQVPSLSVKPRSSVFHYKGVDISPQQIGSQLDVKAILNGRFYSEAISSAYICRWLMRGPAIRFGGINTIENLQT